MAVTNYLSKLRHWFRGEDEARTGQVEAAVDPLQVRLSSGLACLQDGRFEAARECFASVLRDDAGNYRALHFLGILSAQSGDFAAAADLIGKAVKLGPPDAELSSNLGNALRHLGRADEALAAYDRAVAINPDYASAFLNRGSLCLEMSDPQSAFASFDVFVRHVPTSMDGWNGRGDALTRLGRHEEALRSFDQALAVAPKSVNILINRGSALTALRRFDEAVAVFSQVIEVAPDNFIAHYNLGTVMHQGLMSPAQAIPHYDTAIRLKPEYSPSYHNRANALDDLGRYPEAIADFENALHLDSKEPSTFGMLMYSKMRICAWDDYSAHCAAMVRRIEDGERAAAPFMLLAVTGQLSIQRKIADIAADHLRTNVSVLPPLKQYARHDRIRVGYFSADLRNHPVAFLTAELFELHAPEKFEIVVFSFGPYDEMTRRVNSAVEDYIDARTLTDEDVVRLARTLEIDIAVDLGGYTAHNRSGIFAMRAAPIQISYLGYPGTMGHGIHDYLIADRVLIPREHEHWYAEKIVHLPVYQINDSKREIAKHVFTRAELGLPETGFVFCCFNNTVKFNPQIFDIWSRILLGVKDSVLFLLAGSEEATRNLFREAEARGVSKERIVLGGRLARPEYLARYRACDLFLDTLPFNAGTTASDALWAGLPVLTCTGEAFASRMAASLLTALKLPELIAATPEEYERLAVGLASNPEQLGILRTRLADKIGSELLFDTRAVAHHIETAYTMVYERHHLGLSPDTIEISC